MKKLGINLLACAVIGLSACGQQGSGDFETTDSGLQYKFIKEGEGESPEMGKILAVNLSWKTSDDSLQFPAPGQEPLTVLKIDSTNSGMIYEGLKMMKEGDSVEFKLPAKDFFENTLMAQIPPELDSTGLLTFNIGLSDVMSEEDFQTFRMEQMKKQQEKMLAMTTEQMSEDSLKIDEYLAENNIDATTTESGLRYAITKKGNGIQPSQGDTVTVQYTGKLLDGTQFDTSIGKPEPFSFPVGTGGMIQGFDEGIGLLNKGSKATLYIPSPLGYGPRGAGQAVPPNSVLVFDVELVDVKPTKK